QPHGPAPARRPGGTGSGSTVSGSSSPPCSPCVSSPPASPLPESTGWLALHRVGHLDPAEVISRVVCWPLSLFEQLDTQNTARQSGWWPAVMPMTADRYPDPT